MNVVLQPNTIKGNLVEKLKIVLVEDQQLKFSQSDFEDDLDSTIMVRERTKGTTLEETFQKRRGKIMGETSTTVSFLPEGKEKEIKWSKRDVAQTPRNIWQQEEDSSDEEHPAAEEEGRESTCEEVSSSVVEIPPPQETTASQEKTSPEVDIKTEQQKRPPVQATVTWQKKKSSPIKRETRKRKPTQRFGIDLISKVDAPGTSQQP